MLEWSHYETQIQLVWDSLNNKNMKYMASFTLSEAVVPIRGLNPMSGFSFSGIFHILSHRLL